MNLRLVEKITKRQLLFLFTFLIISIVNAQNFSENKLLESYKLLIPDLSVLIDSALVNSGMLKYRVEEIDVKKGNLNSKKRNWTRNFGIQADSRYGTFDNFSNNVSGSNTTTLASTTTQFNYGVGFYLKIPVFDFLNRKSDIKQAKSEIIQAESLIKFQKDEITETVIRYYEDLVLRENVLEIQAINLGDAKANKEMAEKEFRNGLIPIYEYVRICDITAGIATEYENAKSNMLMAKKILENLTGITIY